MDGNIILKFCSIVLPTNCHNTKILYSQKVKGNVTRSTYDMSGKHITVDIG